MRLSSSHAPIRLALRRAARPSPQPTTTTTTTTTTTMALSRRAIASSAPTPASVVARLHGAGPPPDPPEPGPELAADRIARRRRKEELLRQAKEIRADAKGAATTKGQGGGTRLRKRFWQDVHVREVDGAYQIHLDQRPLRRPSSTLSSGGSSASGSASASQLAQDAMRLPLSKPHLAHALALEWDLLESARHASRPHLIPLTQLVCRALDIADDDAAWAAAARQGGGADDGGGGGMAPVRDAVATTLLRHLETDSLLCWDPLPEEDALFGATKDEAAAPESAAASAPPPSLRAAQEAAYRAVAGYVTARMWPGVAVAPVLDAQGSLMPVRSPLSLSTAAATAVGGGGGGGVDGTATAAAQQQQQQARSIVRAWIAALSPWELAGVERATLAGKGLLGAARLVGEWSEDGAGAADAAAAAVTAEPFGVEEAAEVASLEVTWQTRRWGEVEDTHDVEKEDLRRQLGSVVLLVSGTKGAKGRD